jgi:hypothetical protein
MRRPDEGTAGRCARLPEAWNFEDFCGTRWRVRCPEVWDKLKPGQLVVRVLVQPGMNEDESAPMTAAECDETWGEIEEKYAAIELDRQREEQAQSLYDSRNDEHLSWE